jgi:hypothetical protein
MLIDVVLTTLQLKTPLKITEAYAITQPPLMLCIDDNENVSPFWKGIF